MSTVLIILFVVIGASIVVGLMSINETLKNHLEVFKAQSEMLARSQEMSQQQLDIAKYHQQVHITNSYRDYELNELSKKNHEANLKRLELENIYLEGKIEARKEAQDVNPQITDAVTQLHNEKPKEKKK